MSFLRVSYSQNLYGLYEITPTGEILYSRIRKNNALINLQPENVGKNLFDEVLLFDNSAAFRRRIEDFWSGAENMQSFVFDSRFSKSRLPMKILLIRVDRTNYPDVEKFIIVDIREINPIYNYSATLY